MATARALKEETMHTDASTALDLDLLLDLNDRYIRAVRTSDVGWFETTLGEDFRCSLPDGALIDREQFLEHAARPLDVTDLEVHDVKVRLLGDVAIVHARTSYTAPDGRPGKGRYTDVWARRDGRWLAVAAHFTRAAS
jgi:ketosteroid isomerase-like protein